VSVKVTFHGACGIVTGSCFEVRTERGAVLIDCGMFQGTKSIKELNYGPFPFDPSRIDALLLTHAHIDHCGLTPKLVNAGFNGPILASRATGDLLTYVLPDSGYVQETEVLRLNRRNRQRGRDTVEPIYTRADAEACVRRVKSRPINKWLDVAPGFQARFWDAGHILGSTSIELLVKDSPTSKTAPLRLLFSGDIGTGDNMLQKPPEAPQGADYLFVESTYGDRCRPRLDLKQRCAVLRKHIESAMDRGGIILIPAFAVERTQQLLFDLNYLFDTKQLPTIPIFVDSPLATKATQVFAKHFQDMTDLAVKKPFERANIHYVEDVEASRNLNRLQGRAIIIAGSGMCDAGRIRHHLKNHLSSPTATVLLVGYQAPGTLGRLLSQHVPMVRIQGEEVAVNARIQQLDEYSGHADQNGLLDWIQARLPVANNIFLVHGEETARQTLNTKLRVLGLTSDSIYMPQLGETVRLTPRGMKTERIRTRVDIASTAQSDWHNAYAETILDLRRGLEDARDDATRQTILKRVRAALARAKRAS
jgi:metallo-beta-lactamase family protein